MSANTAMALLPSFTGSWIIAEALSKYPLLLYRPVSSSCFEIFSKFRLFSISFARSVCQLFRRELYLRAVDI